MHYDDNSKHGVLKEMTSQPGWYKELLDTANSIILVWKTDGTILFMNYYGLYFFGFSEKEVVGHNVMSTIVPAKAVTGDDLKVMIRNITENPQKFAVNENENIKKDGTRVWISWSNKAVYEMGAVTAVLSVGNDITQRKKLEQELKDHKDKLEKIVADRTKELRASEEKYRALADNAALGITMVINGVWTYANKAFLNMTGYSYEEVMKLPIAELVAPSDRQKVLDRYAKRMQGRPEVNQYETVILRRDGSECSVFMTVGGFIVDDLRGVVATFEDVSDEKRAAALEKRRQEELFQASKMVALGTLVAGVAHEINNPTNFIMLNAPILADVWKSVEPVLDEHYARDAKFRLANIDYKEMKNTVPELIRGVRDGADRIKNIVLGLKDFARKDTSDLRQDVDLNQVLKSSLLLLQNHLKKCPAEFSASYHGSPVVVLGNFQRLEQVVINLLQNACDAVKEKGKKIRASVYEWDNVAIFECADEGVGMDAETLKYIYDPFFTTKRETGGTGLGLSVSSGIVKDHNGEISFESEKGRGTKVLVMIPIKGAYNG